MVLLVRKSETHRPTQYPRDTRPALAVQADQVAGRARSRGRRRYKLRSPEAIRIRVLHVCECMDLIMHMLFAIVLRARETEQHSM